jgi:hypothetical protein
MRENVEFPTGGCENIESFIDMRRSKELLSKIFP